MYRLVAFGLLVVAGLSLGACSMFGSSKSAGAKPTTSTRQPVALNQAAATRSSESQPKGTTFAGVSKSAGIPQGAPAGEGGPKPDYEIGPLDLVEVKVFQLPDLDRQARVDQNGMVTLPLIGPVAAAGKTQSQLEAEIARRYAADYLQDPRVTVFVKEYGSQRVTVAGAVVEPGLFILQGPTTLLEAVALAKGTSDVASSSDIALIRFVNGQRVGTFFDLSDIVKGKTADPVLVGGDIIYVQTSTFRVTMKELLQTSPILSIVKGF